jgi:hypothetical protein
MASPALDRADRSDRYRSLSNFYLADPERIGSREQDVGLWWRIGAHGPVYRAAWLEETGELYAARLGPVQDGEGEVQVLGRAGDRDELEQTLEGWQGVCHQPDSMTWLRHRAARFAPAAPRALSHELPHIAPTGRRVQHAKAAFARLESRPHSAHPHAAPATMNANQSTPRPMTVPRRRINTRLLALVGATAGVTAPATALLLELA